MTLVHYKNQDQRHLKNRQLSHAACLCKSRSTLPFFYCPDIALNIHCFVESMITSKYNINICILLNHVKACVCHCFLLQK